LISWRKDNSKFHIVHELHELSRKDISSWKKNRKNFISCAWKNQNFN